MRENSAVAEVEVDQRSFVTLAFIDLCSSTRLANRLDPDDFAILLNVLRDLATAIVAQHQGIVSQYYGDGMLVLFRGPSAAERAIAATLAIHGQARALRTSWSDGLRLHSGIHSGLVLLRPGDSARGRLETIGRATGIAARLSAAAGPDEILVSRSTLGPLVGRYRVGAERPIEVSGAGDQVSAVPVLDDGQPDNEAAQATGRRTPFIGRTATMREIETLLFGLGRTRPLCIAITGPAGQGKSRLAEEIALRAAMTGALVLRGCAARGEQASTLQPFREVDAGAARILGQEWHQATSELAGLANRVIQRLGQMAEQHRVLLVLDDWQWADSASLQLLARLRGGAAPINIMLLSRESGVGAQPVPADYHIALQPMDEDAASDLVGHLRPDLDQVDRARVRRLAGGNPLYLEELCHLSASALQGLLAAAPSNDEIGRVASIIEERVRQLPQDLATILQFAAIIGEECGAWALALLCDMAPNGPELARLRDLDLLIPSLTAGNVRFKHGVTRNVVYQLMPAARRHALHCKMAELISRRDLGPTVDRDEALAWHCYESGDFARALFHAEAAGDRALGASSIDRAQLQYGRAMKAADELPEDEFYRHRMRLVGKFGLACVYDSSGSQLALLDRALAVANARQDDEGRAITHFWRGYVCHASGRARLAVAEIRQAIALSVSPPDSRFGVQLRATLGQALAAGGRHQMAMPLLDGAIAAKRAHRSGRRISTGLAYTLAMKGAVLGDTGHFDEARAAMDEALDLLGGCSHAVEGSIMGWRAAVCYWQGDWEGMREAAERGCHVALQIEAVYVHAINRAFGAYARWRLTGDGSAAEELARAIDCLSGAGKELALSIAYGCLAEVEAECGRTAAAHDAVRQTFRRAREGEPFGVPMAARAWARVLAPRDPQRARRMLLHARVNAHRRDAPHELARCDLTEAALGLSEPALAAQRIATALSAFTRMNMREDARVASALMQGGVAEPCRELLPA